ncbi:unnamed protein product [Heterosigma akashiwo]
MLARRFSTIASNLDLMARGKTDCLRNLVPRPGSLQPQEEKKPTSNGSTRKDINKQVVVEGGVEVKLTTLAGTKRVVSSNGSDVDAENKAAAKKLLISSPAS